MDSEPVPGNPPSPSAAKDHGGLMPASPVDRAVGGSRSSDLANEFSEFYRTAFAQLVAYLVYLGARVDEASECAQVALEAAVQQWEVIEKPMPWCRTVAKRAYYRRRYDAEESFDEVPPDTTLFCSASGDGCDPGITEICEIQPLLEQLSPVQRQVMALWLSGAKPREIAEETGATPEQVRQNLHLAKQALRRIDTRDRDREGGR